MMSITYLTPVLGIPNNSSKTLGITSLTNFRQFISNLRKLNYNKNSYTKHHFFSLQGGRSGAKDPHLKMARFDECDVCGFEKE